MKEQELKIIDLETLTEFETIVFETYKHDGFIFGVTWGAMIGTILGFVAVTVSLILGN